MYIGMSNPAAKYATEMGYEYQVVNTGAGEEGLVKLPNGEEVDEWEFYSGERGKEYSYCAKMGWQLATKAKKDGFNNECATCKLPDGSEKTVSQLLDIEKKIKSTGTKNVNPKFSSTQASEEDTSVVSLGLPASFDWRNTAGGDWMTPVKNQGSCGSCWAFSALGTVEPQYNISAGDPNLDLDLSEQYLVSDCCTSCGNCAGGNNASALTYIKNNGVPDEGCFPYTASNSSCSGRCADYSSRLKTVEETGYVANNIATIKQNLVEKGPLSVAMGIGGDVGGYFDGNGIYRCTNDTALNHAVVITGYDETGNYWIVKNSWGIGWGDNGYFKVGCAECGIESYVYYATVTPTNPIPTPTPTPAPNIPNPPILVYPDDGASDVVSPINFQWHSSEGATKYWLEVNRDPNWGTTTRVYYDYGDAATNSKTITDLIGSTTYYWRVWAGNTAGWSSPSSGSSFATAKPATPETPTLSSPVDGAEAEASPVTFQWSTSDGATKYWLEVNRDPNWGTATRAYSGYGDVANSSKTVTGLSGGVTYYWHVWAGNYAGWSSPSPGQTFTTIAPPVPQVPALSYPSDGAAIEASPVTLQWQAAEGATKYWLEVNRDPNWSTATRAYYGYVGETNNSKTITGLRGGTTYYWRVWAGNYAGWSSPSSGWSFVLVPPETPTLSSPADGTNIAETSIIFEWTASATASTYWLEVNTDPTWGAATRFYYGYGDAATHSKTVTGFPSNGTIYYWRVWAANSNGWSAPTSGWSILNQ